MTLTALVHTAGHALPISNGYSGTTDDPPSVWCGRCAGLFRADAEWVRRYFDRRLRDAAKPGYFDQFAWRHVQRTPEEVTAAVARLERERDALLATLDATTQEPR